MYTYIICAKPQQLSSNKTCANAYGYDLYLLYVLPTVNAIFRIKVN